MTLRDGKLITLRPHVTTPESVKNSFPLNRLPFYFPIPPVGEWTRSISASHSETQVLRRGAVSHFTGPDLEEISWSSEFLVEEWFENNGPGASTRYFPSYVIAPPAGFSHYGANQAYALLRAIQAKGIVVVLSIQDRNTGNIELEMPVTIRDFSMKEVGGEPDSREYTITFKQYRFMVVHVRGRGATTVTKPGRPAPSRYISSPYVIKKAMGIKKLALLAYKDKSKWVDIVKANGGQKGMFAKGAVWNISDANGPYLLPKGKKFVIPQLQLKGSVKTEVDVDSSYNDNFSIDGIE